MYNWRMFTMNNGSCGEEDTLIANFDKNLRLRNLLFVVFGYVTN